MKTDAEIEDHLFRLGYIPIDGAFFTDGKTRRVRIPAMTDQLDANSGLVPSGLRLGTTRQSGVNSSLQLQADASPMIQKACADRIILLRNRREDESDRQQGEIYWPFSCVRVDSPL